MRRDDAGLDPDELERWCVGEDVTAAVEEDKALARAPMPAARVLDHKLANWSGGRRYTCPSYEIVRVSDGVRIAVPGFQPFARLRRDPGQPRARSRPPCAAGRGGGGAALGGVPLASKEVAVLCGIEVADAREALGRVATERHVGADGFWSLAKRPRCREQVRADATPVRERDEDIVVDDDLRMPAIELGVHAPRRSEEHERLVDEVDHQVQEQSFATLGGPGSQPARLG